ncbi:MAG: hypothetical protein KME17_19185 [Cyanosarcina radialis HA8281-LM2]|jgi:hypothetical protein|nr:hypothetical protein [Cyanosarcina radialis HA8281-LM2]
MNQEIIESLWNLPGLLGIGIIRLEGQPYFYVKPQIQAWEKPALLDLIVQNINKSPSSLKKIEFAVMGYHTFVFQEDLFIKIAILTQTNLVKLPPIAPLITSIKNSLRGAIATFQLLSTSSDRQQRLTAESKINLPGSPNQQNSLTVVNIQELIDILNKVSKLASKYLGKKIIANYLESTRPKSEHLNEVKLEQSGEIVFAGSDLTAASSLQHQLIKTWIRSFVQQCSQVLPYLSSTLEQNLTEKEKTILS